MNKSKKTERLGVEIIIRDGLSGKCTEYNSANDIEVTYSNGEKRRTSWLFFFRDHIPPSSEIRPGIKKIGQKITSVESREEYRKLKKACESGELGVNFNTAYSYMKKHKLSVVEVIEFYKNRGHGASLWQLCVKHGINLNTAYAYKRRYPEKTNEEIMEHYIADGVKKYRRISGGKGIKLCQTNGVDYKRFHGFVGSHREELSDVGLKDRLILFKAMYAPKKHQNNSRIFELKMITRTNNTTFWEWKCLLCEKQGVADIHCLLKHAKKHIVLRT